MKTNKKFKYSLFSILSFVFAFVSIFCLSLNFKTDVANAEGEAEKFQINFVNKNDSLILGDIEYENDMFYDTASGKVVDSDGTEIHVYAKTGLSTDRTFGGWYVYNKSFTNCFEPLGTSYGVSFDLTDLLTQIYSASNKSVYFTENNTITINSAASDETTLRTDASCSEFGNVYIAGVPFSGQIALDYNSEYSFKVSPKAHYRVKSVKIFAGDDYNAGREPVFEQANGLDFTFTTGSADNYTIYVEYEKITYNVEFRIVDRNNNEIISFDTQNHINKTNTTVKIDEPFADKITVNSDNDFRFYGFKLGENDFDLKTLQDSDASFDSTFLTENAVNGKIVVNVVFDRLYKINISSTGEGEFLTYLNGNLVPSTEYEEGAFIAYVSEYESVIIKALPADGSVFENFAGARETEVSKNTLTLSNVRVSRNIVIEFDKEYYEIKVYALDQNKDRLSQFDSLTKVYVNGKASNKLRLGDIITGIVTTENSLTASHRLDSRYYIFDGSDWEELPLIAGVDYVISQDFINKYVAAGQKMLYISARYTRVYNVKISLDSLSLGCGYFDVAITDLDNNTTYVSKTDNYNGYLETGYSIRVYAYSYRGYEFDSFTIPNTGSPNKNMISKIVTNDNIAFGLVYNKTDVAVKISTESKSAKIESMLDGDVKVGDEITLSYKLNFSRNLDKVYINNVKASKLNNVRITDNAIIISITKDFLAGLDKDGNIKVKIATSPDSSFIVFAIVLPLLVASVVAGLAVSLVMYFKSKKRIEDIKKNGFVK